MSQDLVIVMKEPPICTITLNRPEKGHQAEGYAAFREKKPRRLTLVNHLLLYEPLNF